MLLLFQLFHFQSEQKSLVRWFKLLSLWTKFWGVSIQRKPPEQYFHMDTILMFHYFTAKENIQKELSFLKQG